jgi:hypothetical protein
MNLIDQANALAAKIGAKLTVVGSKWNINFTKAVTEAEAEATADALLGIEALAETGHCCAVCA